MATYDISITNRQRLILIQALRQFRIENCPREQEKEITNTEIDCCAEVDPNAESMVMAGIIEDMLETDCLCALYI